MNLSHPGLKRFLDLAIALAVLIVGLPIMLIIAVAIKLDSAGPLLFKQGRLGKDGTLFSMYKFRTMIVGAEFQGTGLCSFADDKRVTRVGKYLRKASLDELPQVFNVLEGTMSIVGPRPPVSYELGEYVDLPDECKNRFKVKPGITGLAQVSGRNSLNWDEKICIDNHYVQQYERLGVFLDIKIILQTFVVMIFMRDVIEPNNES